MENFTAQDDEQFNVIKKVIDLCDYYILILGKRYGSINPNTDISYTEMEYNYAIEKGIPVLVFPLDDKTGNEKCFSDEDDIKKGKLAELKKKAMSKRLGKVWKDQSELIAAVSVSIMKAILTIKRPGWHRGADEEKAKLIEENKQLKEEISLLKQGEKTSAGMSNEKILDQSFYGKKITLHYTEMSSITFAGATQDKKMIEVTLDELFKFLSLRLTGKKSVNEFISAVSDFQDGYWIDKQDALIAKNQYEQFGLIQSSVDKNNNEVIELTELGKEVMNELNF